jgi:hypothetical protein
MKEFDLTDLATAAAESAQDRADLATLRANVDALLKQEHAMTVPIAVRRMVDAGIDPVVIAKTLIIGDRDAGLLYKLSARTPALGHHEQVAADIVWIAIRELQEVTAATMMVAGAVWLVEQFGIGRELLASFITADQPIRPYKFMHERRGWGALDLCDHDGLGNRAWLVDIISKAKLPTFAPLELSRGGS